MRRTRRLISGAITGLILFMTLIAAPIIGPERAYACSCAMVPDMEEALSHNAAIFAGEVTKIDKGNAIRKITSSDAKVEVTFNVEKVWKGDLAKQTKVLTVANEVSCGYHFTDNMSYLVFANESEAGEMYTGLCSGNVPLSSAGELTKQLDAKQQSYEPNAEVKRIAAEAAPLPAETAADSNDNGTLRMSGWAIATAAVLIVLAGFGLWFMRGRRRG